MKIEMKMNRVAAFSALLITGSFVQSSPGIEWDGGGHDQKFTTAANWSHDAVPTSQDTLVIDRAVTVVVDALTDADRISLKNGAILLIRDGKLDCSVAGNTRVDNLGEGSAATVNQTGGSYGCGHRMHIGTRKGGRGVYNLENGVLHITRGGRSVLYSEVGSASLEIGGGGASGILNISGGEVQTRSGVTIGDQGVFNVQGSGATQIGIGSYGNSDGHWLQQAGGILRVGIDDSEAGVTKILVDYVDGGGAGGNVIFEEGALLDVDFLKGKKLGRYVVMEWEGTVTDNGLKFAPEVNTNEWDFYIDEDKKCLVVEARMNEPLGLLISMR